MTDKIISLDDESYSAKPCGCDPRENHICSTHNKNTQCIMGHWTRQENCPACAVLMFQEDKS